MICALGLIAALIAPQNATIKTPESAALAPAGTCLSYAPASVTLVGTLRSKVLTGSPNSQTNWILNLAKPICTADGTTTKPRDGDVWDVQLIPADAEPREAYLTLLNRVVKVTGALFPPATLRNHTKVVLQVAQMEPNY